MADDHILWSAVANDDYAAFDLIVERYYNALVLFSTSVTHDHDASKDVVQELFINLWTNRKRTRDLQSLKEYLYTATRNRSLNHLRSLKRARARMEEVVSSEQNLWSDIIENEVQQLLTQAIEHLPARNREVILHTLEGAKQEKIAELMHVSVRTVKVIKAESIKMLRDVLEISLPLPP